MARTSKKDQQLTTEVATAQAGTVATRKPNNDYPLGRKDLKTIANIISALNGIGPTKNLQAYCALSDEMEERDPVYRSALQTRKLAVLGIETKLEPAGEDKASADIAMAVQQDILDQPYFSAMQLGLLDAISKGFAVSEVMWKIENGRYIPVDCESKPQHWFVFAEDRKTLRLRTGPLTAEDLPPQKFLVHTSTGKAGLPVNAGLAKPVAFLYAIAGLVQQNWLAFCEVFGMPLRIGKYKPGAPPADIAVLKQAVASLGSDASAVFPESMAIEFVEVARSGGDVYQAYLDYADKQKRLLVLGGNLTGGDGGGSGSYALGKVHNEVRLDILKADTRELAGTINKLIAWYVQLNYGPNVKPPVFRFQVAEPEDLLGLATILDKLVPLGLEVSQDEIRSKLGLRAPAKNEPVLGKTATAPQTPLIPNSSQLVANSTATPEPVAPDAIDALVATATTSWKKVEANLQGTLTELVANAEDGEALAEAIKVLDKRELTALFKAIMAVGAKAGASNALD